MQNEQSGSSHEMPKQYDPKSAQKRLTRFWEEKRFFHSEPNRVNSPNRDGAGQEKIPYTIVIPPPNVTGALHLGHALNDTLQDIMIRMKRMQGFETLWLPGVDHAGIATQAVVERQLLENEKKTRHDIGREALVQRIWDWKDKYQTRIISQLKEMGCSCDWERTRFTLDEVCAKAVRHFFFKLFRDKLIYRGKRLVNWDTYLQTAVSDDEVFHETVDGHFWHIQYYLVGVHDAMNNEDEEIGQTYITVATTRPETLLGDTAIAVHPDPEGYLENLGKELFEQMKTASDKDKPAIQEQYMDVMSRKMSVMMDRLKALVKMAKEGKKVRLPLLRREIPIVLDEWAKPDKGTGCVKITPAHDPNDYEVGLRHNLPMINILNRDGTLNENAGPYAGLSIKEARKAVLADLEKDGQISDVEDRKIELAHSDRSKTPIEPFLNDQWFVKMADLAQSAMDAVYQGVGSGQCVVDSKNQDQNQNLPTPHSPLPTSPQVHIYPPRYTKGYLDWLSEKRDWPIGRQLWWGHRIPIWYCDGKITEAELQKAFAGRKDVCWQWDEAKSEWWICSEEEDLAADAVPGTTLTREEDVLDTWFSSALWPHSTLGWPDQTPELKYYYPTSVLITSRDIITLWVARMVLAGLFNTGKIPFHEVYIHPKILDKYGETMSKSKGNGIDPLSVMDKFGADALRFGLAYLTTESQDVCLPLDFECPHCNAVVEQTKKNRVLPRITCPKCQKAFATQWASTEADLALPQGAVVGERFEVARNFCNKLWNAARFTMGAGPWPFRDETAANAPLQMSQLLLEDRWILSRIATVEKEVTTALSAYHFADAARTLYGFAWDEFCSFYVEIVKSRVFSEPPCAVAQRVLVNVLDRLLRLLHPLVPFVTEEIWQRLGDYAPYRGLETLEKASESIVVADWPYTPAAETLAKDAAAQEKAVREHDKWIDKTIESQFEKFKDVLRAVRDIRARQNVPPKTEVNFSVKCDEAIAKLLQPMQPYFHAMSKANATAWGPNVQAPTLSATEPLSGMDVYVDLTGLIDVAAELKKLEKEIANFTKFVQSKESKLSNEAFTSKAPADVIAKEKESLTDLQSQLAAAQKAFEQLKGLK